MYMAQATRNNELLCVLRVYEMKLRPRGESCNLMIDIENAKI